MNYAPPVEVEVSQDTINKKKDIYRRSYDLLYISHHSSVLTIPVVRVTVNPLVRNILPGT